MSRPRYILFLMSLLACFACETPDLVEDTQVKEGEDVVVRINYGSGVDDVKVTKAGLTSVQEAAVYSIYVMTFNQNGARTNSNEDALFYRTDTGGQGTTKTWVDQSGEGNYSKGYIQFNAKSGANTTVYAVANVNTAELSGVYALSSDDLDQVKTLDELDALIVGLNNKAITRGQRILMFGCLKDSENATEPKKVTIGANGNVQTLDGTIYFERTDAKVIFNVNVASGATGIKMELHSWQVFNVPFNAHLVSKDGLGQGLIEDEGLTTFDSSTSVQFDNGNSFTFYMLESNLAPKTELTEYVQREAKNKTESGAYELTDGQWTWMYAPAKSPYVQIRGRLSQTVQGTGDLVHADFVYNVHLGDFGSSANDFWIKPNTQYTYNIYVAGIQNIRTEVETSNDDTDGVTENQPGAEGNVVIASDGSIYEVDAHYAQLVIPFTYSKTFIDAMGGDSSIDDLTWYVSTPYSEGTYEEGENNTETNHYDDELLDYKWVEFYISHEDKMVTYTEYLEWLYSMRRATKSGNTYEKTDPLYVKELVEELKTWYNYMNGSSTEKPTLINAGTPGNTQDIYVTVFVNEFYYDNGNPLVVSNGVEGDGDIAAMVRTVVNAEDRYMHILSNVDYSLDGASSVTNSAATIIQKPIRSIYNIPDFGLLDGYDLIWGTETVSEQYGITRTNYGENSKGLLYGTITATNATSTTNGRLNTYRMWNGQSWSNRMEISDNVWTLKNANTASANPAIYACLARNRDENGNGTVDIDEIKWYMAAIDQLQYMYIGENVMHSDAKLLPSNVTTGYQYYHYLSSTYKSGQGGWILWAEEGLSTSGNTPGWDSGYISSDKSGDYVLRYVRCLRNLGEDGNTASTIGAGMNTLTTSANNVISPTYINSDALRTEKWADATLFHEDRTSLNIPYKGGFEYENNSDNWGAFSGWGDNTAIVTKIENNDGCPTGWRIPNQRELALMYMSGIRVEGGIYLWSATYNWFKTGTSYPNIAGITNQGFTAALGTDGNTSMVRCIRDVDAANTASSYTDQGSLIN